MPIAFPRLAFAVHPEYAPQGRPAHSPGRQNFGELHRPTFGDPLHAKFAEFFLHAVPSGGHERLTARPAPALSPAPGAAWRRSQPSGRWHFVLPSQNNGLVTNSRQVSAIGYWPLARSFHGLSRPVLPMLPATNHSGLPDRSFANAQYLTASFLRIPVLGALQAVE